MSKFEVQIFGNRFRHVAHFDDWPTMIGYVDGICLWWSGQIANLQFKPDIGEYAAVFECEAMRGRARLYVRVLEHARRKT